LSSSRYYASPLRRLLIEASERVEGSRVASSLRLLEDTAAMPRMGLAEWQWQKLKKMIAHAYANVPYYRRVFDEAGLSPDDIRKPADFEGVPILTKKAVRENLEELRATSLPAGTKVVTAQTGGTTGEPLKFLRDVDCNSLTRAALLRSYTWTGYRLGDSMLFLTGGSLLGSPQTLKQKLGFKLMNYHFMPGFRLRAETLSEYVDVVRQNGVRFLRGYSTLLHQFAALCEAAGHDDLHLTAVYPTAEMLTNPQRETIERVFNATVYDHYGCAEINALANECPEGRKRHIIEEHVLAEEISSDALGDNALVFTDLDNFAQPFIRYANGDRGRISKDRCVCGRNLAVLEEFLGRSSDEIVLASGDPYPGVFFHHLFGHFPGVTQFQVVQDKPGELVIRIIKSDSYAHEHEGEIKRLVAEHTGIIASVDYVDEIERSRSGKISSVISNIRKN
jgi:phenylacetate-CoA ligase